MYSPFKTTNRSTIVLAGVFAWSGMALPGFADGATRDLPDSYTAGVAFTVSISVEPTPGTLAWVAEDSPPEGWTEIDNVNDGGLYDSGNHKVKWGLFLDDQPRTLTYDITPPGDATGGQCFEGGVFFDGYPAVIGGDQCIRGSGDAIPALSEWGVATMTLLMLTAGTLVLRRPRRVQS